MSTTVGARHKKRYTWSTVSTFAQAQAEVKNGLSDKTDLTLTLDKAVLDHILLGHLTMRDALLGGSVKVSQAPLTAVAQFFGYFELPLSTPMQHVVR